MISLRTKTLGRKLDASTPAVKKPDVEIVSDVEVVRPPPLKTRFDAVTRAEAIFLDHAGASIEHGLRFIQSSLDCLRPGGIAVHTTEFNCDAGENTLDNDSTVLFRRSDFLGLAQSLAEAGHELALNFDLGDQPLDAHIDAAPYSHDNHLKLALAGFVTTSFGIIVRKGGMGR